MTHVRGTFWQNTQQTRRHLKVLAGPSLQGSGSDCKCSGTLRAGCENSGVLKLARVEIFNHRHWQTLGVKTFLLLFSEPARVSKNRWQTEQRGFSYSCCTIVTAIIICSKCTELGSRDHSPNTDHPLPSPHRDPVCPSAVISCPHTQVPAATNPLCVLEGLEQKRGRGLTCIIVTIEFLLLNYIKVSAVFSD